MNNVKLSYFYSATITRTAEPKVFGTRNGYMGEAISIPDQFPTMVVRMCFISRFVQRCVTEQSSAILGKLYRSRCGLAKKYDVES